MERLHGHTWSTFEVVFVTFYLSKSEPSLQSLLDDPNPASPLNAEAAQLWSENKKLYTEKVKAHYEKIDKQLNKQ